jgi:hypothetical protein
MERFCERCERITVDGHLWCQERDCPAEEGFPVFGYGDYVGDLKITKLIVVWRTAALYEAQRGERARDGEQTVWVKVAHAGPECEERLKREAALLATLNPARAGGLNDFRAKPRPILPVWLPPYPIPSKRPHGEITVDGATKLYSVHEPLAGTLLSDLLLTNPHVWHYEAAWVTNTLAEALKPLAARNLLHLGLTPDRVMVEIDKDGHWRATLLDLGWLINSAEAATLKKLGERSEPAYTAPEALAGQNAAATLTQSADVYALGLLFYEMLAGHPAFEPKLRRDEWVSRAVVATRAALPVDRPELMQAGVVKVLEKAIAPTAADRYATLAEFSQAVAAIYGAQPKEKRPLPRRTTVLLWTLVALLAVTLCVTGFLLAQVWLGG